MPLTIHPVPGIPEISAGDDLATIIAHAIVSAGLGPEPGDIVVVTHKVVSKAEGAVRPIETDADYRALIEDEAVEVIRRRGDLVITRTRHGFICANAGVDRSNAAPGTAVLLPFDPDRSAHGIRLGIEAVTGADVPVIVTDTFGRPWRSGVVDVAIGVSGIEATLDLRGTPDANGRLMEATEIAVVDEIAAAADLAMGKATSIPVAVVRGLSLPPGDGRAAHLVRPAEGDMFR